MLHQSIPSQVTAAKDAILSTIGNSNWVHKNLSKILKTTAFYKNHLVCVAK
jgi:hypothetical protein